jgi:hypothetical protein
LLKELNILGTAKTPSINLDPNGLIRIHGRSIPEDANTFFDAVKEWIDEYVTSKQRKTIVDINLEYLNSGTSKFILQILKKLKDNSAPDQILTINWHYEDGDDDIYERGEYFASILGIKINFIEVE